MLKLGKMVPIAAIIVLSPVLAWGKSVVQKGPVEASLIASADAIVPDSTFMLGLRLKLQEHRHTYWINPGESGAATRIDLSGPQGFEFGAIQWPLPQRIEAPGGISFGYEDEVLLLVPVKVSKAVALNQSVTLTADAWWLSCKEDCIEGSAKLTITLPVAAEARPANRELFDMWVNRLPLSWDQRWASKSLLKVEQWAAADGSPLPALAVQWRQKPRKVEWFPVSTRVAVIEKVEIKGDAGTTAISFKPKIYKAEQAASVDSLLVYEDGQGRRHGIMVPVRLAKP